MHGRPVRTDLDASRCAALEDMRSHRHVVLLQGPAGPFFRHLAIDLAREPDRIVEKIHLNGGDEASFGSVSHPRIRMVRYDGSREDWGGWLAGFLRFHHADAIGLFGQCRHYHAVAIEVARQLGLAVFVFEEGYVRPNYVTIERGGVNGASSLPRDPAFYRDTGAEPAPQQAGAARAPFARMAAWHATYYVAARLSARRYPHYRHHRPLDVTAETARWIRGGLRKLVYAVSEAGTIRRLLSAQAAKRYFVVPLQVHNDSQVTHHSPYASVAQFIEEVVQSFARHAPAGTWLVFKHHPMDRAYTDYRRLLAELARAYGLAGRLLYVHDAPLPALLRHAIGAVTINSTVGFSALLHGTPCFVCGECIYALPGLARNDSLHAFWRAPGSVDRALVQAFRSAVIRHTQLAGSFYDRVALGPEPAEPGPQPAAQASPAAGPQARAHRATPLRSA